MQTALAVVEFWENAGAATWFARSPGFDEQVRSGFGELHLAAARGECRQWSGDAMGSLALVLLLDQFPRNIYRGSAHAFATDPLARVVAAEAIHNGHDRQTKPALRLFFYLPFAHAEDLDQQQRSVDLTQALADEVADPRPVRSALRHRDVIARFGRFPHRNPSLGRITTPQEQAFLDAGGFAG